MIIRFLLLFLSLGVTSSFAEVVINELSARQSDRLLRWDANDQPYTGPGHPWWSVSFDDTAWLTGETPIGFNDGTIFAPKMPTNLKDTLEGISPSVYTRHVFTADAASAGSGDDLTVTVVADDAFIVWLNGHEIGRRNMGAAKAHLYFDQVAYREAERVMRRSDIVLGKTSDFLVAGENTLAVQLANVDLVSDMSLEMKVTVGEDNILVPFGASVKYLPGLLEPNADVFEPAALAEGASDWIELHNNGAEAVDLTGWTLTDDQGNPNKWTFPDGTTIPAGDYLLVLTDNPDEPIPEAHYLHAAFRLSANGDYVGLFDGSGTLQSEVPAVKHYHFHSYGSAPEGEEMRYLAVPTPGAANTGPAYRDRVDAPDFDPAGGFYDEAVTVSLSSQTEGAVIRYTTDGTEPTASTGLPYTEPFTLEMISDREGHVIRARAFQDGMIPSNSKTNTYLIGQDPRVRTAPTLIFSADLPRNLYDPYGALAIHGGSFSGNEWKAREEDAYNNVVNRGRAYERPIHAEFYFADGSAGFRSNVGARIAASNFSRPRMTLNRLDNSPWQDGSGSVEKPSFNLYFRNDYGNPSVTLPFHGENASVKDFEQFRVRAGKNDSRNPFIMDELMRRLSKAMGQPASTGVINTLYVNGELKGIYNMTERVREPFLRAYHDADPDSEWDILQYEGDVFTVDQIGNPRNNITSGDKLAFEDLLTRLQAEETVANWETALELIDVENIADYFLFNIYTAMWDWPHNNWILTRERSSRGRFRGYVWDAEGGIGRSTARNASTNIIDRYILGTSEGSLSENGTEGELRDLWRGLTRWEEFRLLFADRIHKHLFNGGALDDRDFENSVLNRLSTQVVDEYDDLLDFVFGQTAIGTHARNWATTSGGKPRRDYLFGPERQSFRDHDLWPNVDPPEFSQFGGSLTDGALTITSSKGDLYYTTDGTDPRLPGGEPNPAAIISADGTAALQLTEAATVKARRLGDNIFTGPAWSALTSADFTIDTVPSSSSNLAISEILYNPSGATPAETAAGYDDGDEFEFLRLKNFGEQAIDLHGVRFVDGITYDFDAGAIRSLAPGGEVLIVSNLEAFRQRYGTDHDEILAGSYRGQLSNGGEQLRLIDANGETLHDLNYETKDPWPDLGDLDGHAIQLSDPSTNPAEGAKWSASSEVGGSLGGNSPGNALTFAQWQETSFPDPSVSAPNADPDHDGLNNVIEFALGTPPLSSNNGISLPDVITKTVGDDQFLVLEYTRQPGDQAVEFAVQTSSDLVTWADGNTIATTTTNPNGTISTALRDTNPVGQARYARLKITIEP